jgi:hypothetical protein
MTILAVQWQVPDCTPATPETVVPAGNVNVNEEIVWVPVFSMMSLVAFPSTPH